MKDKLVFKKEVKTLVDYYFLFRELVTLHRTLGFGKAPRLSEGFTEKLCATLFGFEKAENVNREYDLYDPLNNLRIEVKATSDDYGSTTINPHSKFDYLYWINFQLDLNCLWIKVVSYESIHKILTFTTSDKRVNVTLSKAEGLGEVKYYLISKDLFDISEMSVKEQLEYIKSHKSD